MASEQIGHRKLSAGQKVHDGYRRHCQNDAGRGEFSAALPGKSDGGGNDDIKRKSKEQASGHPACPTLSHFRERLPVAQFNR
jgi:hypothetical protein